MTRLENVSVERVGAALEERPGGTAVMRLLLAIIYKRGPSVPMLAEWLDIRPQTIYRWFDRLETEPVQTAIQDRERTGRPPKLTNAERREFLDAIQESPRMVGFDKPEWTAPLCQEFLHERFGVEYSRRHVRRLLREAQLARGE